MKIRIVIADDHAVVREGLRRFLALDPDFEVVGEARDGQEVMDLVRQVQPDVVLMDLLMPRCSGLEAIRALRSQYPETEVLAVTSVLEPHTVAQVLQAGAIGYLLKDTQGDELCRSIRAASEGRVQLSSAIRASRLTPTAGETLTERESEVLVLLASGESNREIATKLLIGETTVKTHVTSILAKLGVYSRTQAALEAVRRGWVSHEF